MDDINQFLFPLWNLSPAAPGWLVTLARLSSEYLSKIALAWVFVLLVFGKPAWRRMAIQVLVAIAIVWLVARGIHETWPQPRPFMVGQGHQWIEHSPSPSFPSRHATIAMAFGVMALLTAPRRWVGVLCLVVALMVGWSRVALGVHFPMDIIAGALIATPVAVAVRTMWLRGWPFSTPRSTSS